MKERIIKRHHIKTLPKTVFPRGTPAATKPALNTSDPTSQLILRDFIELKWCVKAGEILKCAFRIRAGSFCSVWTVTDCKTTVKYLS